MVITFDVLDRFQENKVFQTAQTIRERLLNIGEGGWREIRGPGKNSSS